MIGLVVISKRNFNHMKPGKNSGRYFALLYIAIFGCVALVDGLADKKTSDTNQKSEEIEKPSKKPVTNVKKGKSRPLKTSTVMKSVIKPHCGILRKMLKGEIKSDDDWAAVIAEAEILSEASYILMSDGRCPDEVWSGAATQTLRYCSQVIISAAEEKNPVVVRAAFGKLTESCSVCHDAHREKSPLMELIE